MIAALTVLPALLAVLGHRVNALPVRKSVRAGAVAKAEAEGGWYRLAQAVMRRPVAFVSVIVIVLLALGTPFLRISWGGTDARVLPASSTVRQVQDALTNEFPANSTNPIEAVVTGVTSPAQLTGYTNKIAAIPGVTGAQATARHGRRRPARRRLHAAARLAAGQADRHQHQGARAAAARRRPRRRHDRAGSSTSCPASAAHCPGWRCSPRWRRSCCSSWPSARWCCRSRRS